MTAVSSPIGAMRPADPIARERDFLLGRLSADQYAQAELQSAAQIIADRICSAEQVGDAQILEIREMIQRQIRIAVELTLTWRVDTAAHLQVDNQALTEKLANAEKLTDSLCDEVIDLTAINWRLQDALQRASNFIITYGISGRPTKIIARYIDDAVESVHR